MKTIIIYRRYEHRGNEYGRKIASVTIWEERQHHDNARQDDSRVIGIIMDRIGKAGFEVEIFDGDRR